MIARFTLAALLVLPSAALAQQVTKAEVQGVRNFARLESSIACAGATAAEAVPEIKKMGFAAIINLREATEPEANLEAEEAAAKASGLRYYHVPFNGQSPDPAAADKFLAAITANGSEPAFIHCAGGNRAAAMWLIKRLAIDRWAEDKAVAEATALGLTSAALRDFAIQYASTHRR